ncbi:hypothetical protein BT96DRAFT_1021848 [Gymnopus androsaceus JB14]|uniref:Uncharacterized protein n=1 Tax=Gymnopus androsaceus JB14 TaxID=1447944 RepID=A0A6A4HEK2_9AGAR|nr:hypothetical protein BT96DRAFT_1021848 [Gymnopus androsaceus JB14]
MAKYVATLPEDIEMKDVDDNEAKAKKKAEALKKAGSNAYKKKRLGQAAKNYQQAWDTWPKDITLLTHLGAVYFEQGKYEEAIETYEKAVEEGRSLRSDFKLSAEAYLRVGSSYGKKGDILSAIKYYEKSLMEHRALVILNHGRSASALTPPPIPYESIQIPKLYSYSTYSLLATMSRDNSKPEDVVSVFDFMSNHENHDSSTPEEDVCDEFENHEEPLNVQAIVHDSEKIIDDDFEDETESLESEPRPQPSLPIPIPNELGAGAFFSGSQNFTIGDSKFQAVNGDKHTTINNKPIFNIYNVYPGNDSSTPKAPFLYILMQPITNQLSLASSVLVVLGAAFRFSSYLPHVATTPFFVMIGIAFISSNSSFRVGYGFLRRHNTIGIPRSSIIDVDTKYDD